MQRKKVSETNIFKCGKCNEGEISITHEFDGEETKLYIKKCTNSSCKHQYYIREILNTKLEKNINNMNHNCTLSDVFIQISKYEDTIHLPTFIRLRSSYYDEREKLKTEIWQLIDSDERFTYERTSEIFITKGLKKNEKLLDFYPKERHGSNNEGSYISHLVVRKNFK